MTIAGWGQGQRDKHKLNHSQEKEKVTQVHLRRTPGLYIAGQYTKPSNVFHAFLLENDNA